jgi:protein-S-isoprenylcysteine O-methyltransferase Ste14
MDAHGVPAASGGQGRGGGWVVAQFALIALVVGAVALPPGWPADVRGPLLAIGGAFAVAGATVAVWAALTLGRSLTPFPKPAAAAVLVEAGPFRRVRHPIYTGGLAFFLGWSLYAGPVALALTGVLVVLWALKARVEERHLADRFPGYAGYARRVRARFVPGLY